MRLTLLAIVLLFGTTFYGQITCDSIAKVSASYLNTDRDKQMNRVFISDGQVYNAFLDEDQTAEFETTFFGGSTYRITASAGTDDNYIIFYVYDRDRNLLFTNYDHGNAPYWDFKVENTIDCIIEAKLDMNKKLSGCLYMMIGFEKMK